MFEKRYSQFLKGIASQKRDPGSVSIFLFLIPFFRHQEVEQGETPSHWELPPFARVIYDLADGLERLFFYF